MYYQAHCCVLPLKLCCICSIVIYSDSFMSFFCHVELAPCSSPSSPNWNRKGRIGNFHGFWSISKDFLLILAFLAIPKIRVHILVNSTKISLGFYKFLDTLLLYILSSSPWWCKNSIFRFMMMTTYVSNFKKLLTVGDRVVSNVRLKIDLFWQC